MSKQARNALMVSALFLAPLAIAEERINPVDGAVMVRVPAGEFVMGKKGSESHFRDERYSHKVQLSEFWIYKHEVTNAQWLKFIDATGYAHRASLDIHGLDEAEHPVVAVSWQDAASYCRWAKMSLPTETQWEYAARGPKANLWPWGDKFDPGKVSWALGMKRPGTSPVGRHPDGASWCGALDMAGNAWEWCLDWYIYGYPSSPDNRDPVQLTKPGSSRERKILRGGGWIQVGGWQGKNGYQLRGSYRYGAALWKHRSIYNGFRCASGDTSLLDAGKLESRAAPRKTGPSYYTQEEIRSIRANIKKYPWAADQMKVSGHVSYLSPGLSDDLAWSRLTSQDVPRAYKAKYWPDCPLCKKPGTKFFGIVYKVDGGKKYEAWKMKCGGCGERFPKNDFLKFYKSGLDELGIFRLYRANRKLLFNVEHPDPKDPLHLFAVDDGAGWLDESGQRFYWIGRYNDIRMNHYSAGMDGYAGDCLKSPSTSYRRRLALLIYRKAMLYPEFDWRECWKLGMFHSSGGSGDGRAIGRIWENSAGLNSFAYDLVYDLIGKDAGLLAAIQARMPKHLAPKTGDDIRRFIEKNYIGEVLDAYFGSWPGIRSNVGPNLKGLITTAIVLDDPLRTPAALDRVYSQQMGEVFETYIDRDGAGYEGAPGYTFGWSQSLHSIAKTIARTKYRKYGLYQRYPIWRRMYLTPYLITALDRFTPHVEDHATCGKPGMTAVRMNTYLDAFQRMKDPIFAQIAYVANGNKFDGMIGDPTQKDPASIREEVRKVIEEHGPIELPSTNLNGYGMVMLRSGKGDHRRAAFLYYGRQGYAGHGQYDSLNMGIFFNGINVSPDMGYPEYTTGHPKSNLWTRNTIAHNCVIVDRSRQRGLWIGNCLGFHQGPGLAFAEVDSTRAYFPGQPQSMYRRTLAMVDIDEESSYFVDVFRVRGGREHVYSFHGADGNLKVTGTNLTRQETGTYLGADTEYGKGGRQGSRSGYQFLHDVSRSENVPGGFLADWSILDNFKIQRKPGQVHLRLTMLNDCDDVAIATGHPAWSMPAETESKKYRPIRYLLARRRPKEKRSDFVTVIEPSLGESKLRNIELLPAGDHAVVVRVATAGGRVDSFASSLSTETEVKTEDFSATGRWAFLSTKQKAPVKMFLMGGTSIQAGKVKFQLASSSFKGKVDALGNTPEGEARFTTNASLPAKGSLTGHQIRFNTSTQYKDVFGPRDTWFEIRNVQRTPDGKSRVTLGDFRLTTGYKDAKNHKLGLRTLFNVGDSFEIPSCMQFQRTEAGWRLHSTSNVSIVLSEPTTSFLCRVGSGEWQELSGVMKEGAIPCSQLPNGNLDLRSNLKE